MPGTNKSSAKMRDELSSMLEECAATREGGCPGCPVESRCVSIWESISRNMTIKEKSYLFYKEVLVKLRRIRDGQDVNTGEPT